MCRAGSTATASTTPCSSAPRIPRSHPGGGLHHLEAPRTLGRQGGAGHLDPRSDRRPEGPDRLRTRSTVRSCGFRPCRCSTWPRPTATRSPRSAATWTEVIRPGASLRARGPGPERWATRSRSTELPGTVERGLLLRLAPDPGRGPQRSRPAGQDPGPRAGPCPPARGDPTTGPWPSSRPSPPPTWCADRSDSTRAPTPSATSPTWAGGGDEAVAGIRASGGRIQQAASVDPRRARDRGVNR